MNTPITLQARVQDYLAERRRLGFQLKYPERLLMDFARYVDSLEWAGPLTLDVMSDWAQLDKQGRHKPETWARRFKIVCPSLGQTRVTVHRLRHTMAMDLLQAGVDRSVIALWLGHESVETTQIYLEATLAMKEQALARTTPPQGKLERYQTGDKLLNFLNSL